MKLDADVARFVLNTDDINESPKDDSDHYDPSSQSEDNDGPSDDELQLEDEHPSLKRLQDLVALIKKTKITSSNSKEYFGKKGQFVSHLAERSERNNDCILHLLVKEDAKGDEIRNLANGIKYIARYHQKLTLNLNDESQTPLYCALENLDKKGAYLIKRGFFNGNKKDHMAKVIAKRCGPNEENCLHRAFKSFKSGFLDSGLLNLLIDSASQQTVNARDKQDWTPLHHAVKFEHSSEERLNIIRKLIEVGEPTPDSPRVESAFVTYCQPGDMSVYQYHMKTREDEKSQRKEAKERAARNSTRPPKPRGKEDPRQREEAENGRPFERNGALELQFWADRQERAFPMPSRSAAGMNAERGQEDFPKPGIARMNTNIKRSDSNSRLKGIEAFTGKAQERERWSQEIRNELKLHCLRTKPIAQATRFVYGTNKDDVQLYFDYRGLPEDADPKTFYDNFQTTQFDEVLQYVVFPLVRLKQGKNTPGVHLSKNPALCDANCNGRKDLLFFFSWLKDKGVKHIIKVIVDDSTDSHCDEVIGKCLSPFRIDILDWSKPDLDPEIIFMAAPNVKELHLRWGGNNAVLRSWGEAEGLRLLKDLRTVHLYHGQSSDYTKQKLDAFIRRIAMSVPATSSAMNIDNGASGVDQDRGADVSASVSTASSIEIKVKSEPDHSRNPPQVTGTTASGGSGSNKPTVPVHKWLDSIDTFTGELKNLMHKIEKTCHRGDEVRIALIDDGVDLCEKAFCDRIIHGKSLGYWAEEQRAKQWYVSESGHGTVMAHMIIRVCPMAKIYPIKLDTTKDPVTGASRIKPESAAAAIDAAVEKGAHIISMSWTVDEPHDETKKKLDKALERAYSKGILMFCSSPDEGNYGSGDPYPSAYAPAKFFRIGASQADGHAYSWVALDKVDYIFPGVEVVQANRKDIELRGVEDRKAGTGSSISTALAAGLAALVIWFVIIGAKYSLDEYKDGDGLDGNDVRDIKDIKKMKQAFQKLGASRESNGKFIEIWTVLDDRSKALNDLHGNEDIRAARQVIHKLARNLIVKT